MVPSLAAQVGALVNMGSLWNALIVVRAKATNETDRHHADRLLSQYNTASGARIKDEIRSFLKSVSI